MLHHILGIVVLLRTHSRAILDHNQNQDHDRDPTDPPGFLFGKHQIFPQRYQLGISKFFTSSQIHWHE